MAQLNCLRAKILHQKASGHNCRKFEKLEVISEPHINRASPVQYKASEYPTYFRHLLYALFNGLKWVKVSQAILGNFPCIFSLYWRRSHQNCIKANGNRLRVALISVKLMIVGDTFHCCFCTRCVLRSISRVLVSNRFGQKLS